MLLGWVWFCIVGLCCAALPLQAQTLRWAARGDALSMDPHASLDNVTINLNALVHDGLVELDRNGRIVPALATSWSLVSPTLWRFQLRKGVKFHDGSPLTAADVVFSIERAQQPGSRFAAYAVPLGKPVRIDDHVVELRQDSPNPLLLDQLSLVLIMSRDWALAHAAQKVASPGKNSEAWSSRHAMGTGRYLLRQYEPDVRTLLSRNPAWWGRFEGNVEQVVFTPVANDATRTAALSSGDLDLIQDLPLQDIDRIAADTSLRVIRSTESRLILFGFDQFRRELLYSSVKGRNPFQDARVREAFALAIDVEVLKARIMRGHARPTGCVAAVASACFAAATEAHPAPDIARARRLMAEAGYAEGFALTLDCPNDRYLNDRALCTAVGGMLARIGVTLRVDARPKSLYFTKLQSFDISFYLHGYAQPTADPQLLLDPLLHSLDARTGRGNGNYGRFADADIDRALDAAGSEMDPKRREALLGRAQAVAAERHYLLPIHRQMVHWASRANVQTVATTIDQVRVDWTSMR